MQGLSQIKQDLGKFSDDPEKNLDKFRHLTMTFELTWRDVYIILARTLSQSERTTIYEATAQLGDGYHVTNPQQFPRGTVAGRSPDGTQLGL